jgi:hypothetical protein
LIVAAQGNSTGPASVTLGSGFSNLQNDSGNFVSIESQVQATAGAIAGTFTISASSGACGVLTFVPPADALPFNVWTPEGNVLPNGTSPTIVYSNPNVIFEGNPQILAGPNVFKMWCQGKNGATYGIYYFESADGLTTWTPLAGNTPVFTSGAPLDPKVYHVASLYYIYTGQGTINLETSANGVSSFTNQGTVLSPGSAGQWDSAQVFQLALADVSGGVWTAYYGGTKTGGAATDYHEGIATSPDGIVWTKGGSNPVFAGGGNPTFHKVGSTYYAWAPAAYTGIPLGDGTSVHVDIARWSAPAVTGPWTKLQFGGKDIATFYAAIPADLLATQAQWPGNQIGDPSVVEANGNTYIYYTLSYNGAPAGLNGAVAAGFTMAQLVGTYEGVVGAPLSGNPSANLVTLATDPGTGANANPIGGQWSLLSTTAPYSVAQRLSNLIQGTTATAQHDSWQNVVSWPNGQWSQSVVSVTAAAGYVGAACRASMSNAITEYRVAWGAAAPGSPGTWFITKLLAGTGTNATGTGFTVNVGDTMMCAVNGSNIYWYWNGILIGMMQDSSITSGAAGFQLNNGAVVANAAISSWSGGTFQDAPLLSASISGNAGAGGVTVTYSGASSGSVVADSFGNYILPNLVNGSYTITPSLAGHTFSPSSSSQTMSGTNITGVNFVATLTPVTGHYSVPDARNYGNFPNLSTNVNGTLTYTVPAEYSLKYWFDILFNRTQPLPEDCRAAGAPVASGTYPQNSRAPGVNGPNN